MRASPTTDLAGALHEVSNALTVILGWVERARAEGALHDAAWTARALEVAASRARDARNIVRSAIGAEVPDDPPRTLSALVEDALIGLENEAHRADVRLTGDVDPAVAELSVPAPVHVIQILTNLLLNAIAASPPGGVVRLDAAPMRAPASIPPGLTRRARDRGVTFGVQDEGPGIPEDRREGIFTEGLTTRVGGAGIGLRHAAALARSEGGRLVLCDTPAGARFELGWPVVASDAPRSERRSQSLPVLAGARILVVEDDRAVIDLLELALSARGAEIVAVQSQAELAEALSTGAFQAALFDISPIQEDIAGALGVVRSTCPGVRLIVMSGSAGLPVLPAGFDAIWVRKPFEVDEIVRALGDL